MSGLTQVEGGLVLGCALMVIGLVAHLVVTDTVRRIVALNVGSGGVMVILLSLAVRGDEPDPVPQALVLTGIVIMAGVTGLALGLARRTASLDEEVEDA